MELFSREPLDIGTLAGIIVICSVFLILILVAIWYVCRRKKRVERIVAVKREAETAVEVKVDKVAENKEINGNFSSPSVRQAARIVPFVLAGKGYR